MNEASLYRIHSIPETERPREKLLIHGEESLTLEELIAAILGSGTKNDPVLKLSKTLIHRFHTLPNLMNASIEELCEVSGIGIAKAIQLKATFAISKRLSAFHPDPKPLIQTPKQADQFLRGCFNDFSQESIAVLLLDVKSRLIGKEMIVKGGLSNVCFHPREVFFPAIRQKACSILVAHTHPSGDLTPSEPDLQATKSLVQAGKTLQIPLVDHLILSANDFISIRKTHSNLF